MASFYSNTFTVNELFNFKEKGPRGKRCEGSIFWENEKIVY